MKLWRLKRRVKKNPDDGAARIALSEALLSTRDPRGALDQALAAVDCALEPEDCLALGQLFVDLGRKDAAERAYRHAWTSAPDSLPIALAWGRFLLSSGRADDALEPLGQAVELDPADDGLRLLLIDALQATGADAEAASHLAAVVGRNRDDAKLHVRYGRAMLAIGEHEPALAALRRARRLADTEETTIALGVALGQTGRSNEAVALFERFMAARPDSLSALINCAVAHGEMGDDTTAVRYLLDAARRAPEVAAIQQNLGITFMRMGQLDAAVESFRRATALAPDSAHAQLQLARALTRRGDIHEAIGAATLASRLAGKAKGITHAADDLLQALMETATGEYPALSMSSDGLERPSAISGVLTEFPLPNLLEFLRNDRRTGSLQIVALKGVGEIWLREGDIVAVSASGVPRLGQMLVDAGHLSRAALAHALEGRSEGAPLGKHLAERGTVSAETVSTMVKEQIDQGLMELLPWEQGNFSFAVGDGLPVEERFGTQSALLDALRRLDEAGYSEAADSMEQVADMFGDTF